MIPKAETELGFNPIWIGYDNLAAMKDDKSTTLPKADTMGAYRSTSKGYRDRPLLYDIAAR